MVCYIGVRLLSSHVVGSNASGGTICFAFIDSISLLVWLLLVILPLLGVLEKPLPQPETIEEDFDKKYPPKEANLGPSPTEVPAE